MPARLGRYAVRRRIGAGAFATVWLAYDEHLDSPVAVKVLADNWTEDQAVRHRFLAEGRFLRKVESPHVVTVYDAGELDDGRPYLVMSYADQGTLADRLEIDGLTSAQALQVVREIGAGLQALHERGVLHRDLKPANVLLRAVDGRVRAMVADLGLGKSMEMSSRLTAIAGTPSFVAPEQAQGEPLDARADLYSLTALTYLLLSGRAAFSHASLAAAAAPGPPPPLSTPERPFSAEVEAVLFRGLAADREHRWPDIASYVAALSAALAEGPASAGSGPAGSGPDGSGPAGSGPAGSGPAGSGPDVSGTWLQVDPQLTQPGAAPSLLADREPLPAPVSPPRWPRRALGVVAAALVLVGSGVAGWLLAQRTNPEVTVTDDEAAISVTVPAAWHRVETTDGWQPPNSEDRLPAVLVSTRRDWAEPDSTAPGVFAGVLPGNELPRQLPQHPECARAGSPVGDTGRLGASSTVVYAGCPGGYLIERVVRVTDSQLLWVQVRSADRRDANRVLDGVAVHGMS